MIDEAVIDDGPRLEVHVDRQAARTWLVVSILMIPVGLGLMNLPGGSASAAWVGAVAAVVAPLGIFHFARALRLASPRIVIDADGIRDTAWPFGLVRWERIAGVAVHVGSADAALNVLPIDLREVLSGVSPARRIALRTGSILVRGRSPLHVRTIGLDRTAEDLVAFIVRSGYADEARPARR